MLRYNQNQGLNITSSSDLQINDGDFLEVRRLCWWFPAFLMALNLGTNETDCLLRQVENKRCEVREYREVPVDAVNQNVAAATAIRSGRWRRWWRMLEAVGTVGSALSLTLSAHPLYIWFALTRFGASPFCISSFRIKKFKKINWTHLFLRKSF